MTRTPAMVRMSSFVRAMAVAPAGRSKNCWACAPPRRPPGVAASAPPPMNGRAERFLNAAPPSRAVDAGLSVALGGSLVLLAVVVAWFQYNRVVSLRNRCTESWSNVDTELRRRYDLIP